MLPFIIIGIVTGSVYGLAGVGLVLTYKTSGIFNFAQGALATVAAYAFYYLNVDMAGVAAGRADLRALSGPSSASGSRSWPGEWPAGHSPGGSSRRSASC